MQKIVPHLWFDTQAVEAATFYTAAFPGSAITSHTRITGAASGNPSGDLDIVNFHLSGYGFQALNAGPYFQFNPSVSFLVSCTTKEEVEQLHQALSVGGSELMPLGEYPFSPWYSWITDRYGLSWQIMYLGERPFRQKIVPVQMFTGANAGRAEEALRFYTSLFPGASETEISRYGAGAEPPNTAAMVNHGAFTLADQHFALMDSALDHGFTFNEAISYIVLCDSQEELDNYWNALTADPDSEACGWLKDKYGFSWQIVPRDIDAMMAEKDQEKLERVTKALLAMKKLDIAALRRAAEG